MANTFTTVARYTYSSEAEIIKGRLEAEGIEVFLKDNITIDTDPLVSNAIGGIKLNVLNKDSDKALEILNSMPSYSVNDSGEPMRCPNCGQHNISLYSTITNVKSLISFLVGFVTGTLPFSARYQHQCDTCNTIIKPKH